MVAKQSCMYKHSKWSWFVCREPINEVYFDVGVLPPGLTLASLLFCCKHIILFSFKTAEISIVLVPDERFDLTLACSFKYKVFQSAIFKLFFFFKLCYTSRVSSFQTGRWFHRRGAWYLEALPLSVDKVLWNDKKLAKGICLGDETLVRKASKELFGVDLTELVFLHHCERGWFSFQYCSVPQTHAGVSSCKPLTCWWAVRCLFLSWLHIWQEFVRILVSVSDRQANTGRWTEMLFQCYKVGALGNIVQFINQRTKFISVVLKLKLNLWTSGFKCTFTKRE